MDSLGEKIRQLRKQKDLSQEEFAFRLNVSRQTVSRWENDEMVPNADNLRSICEVLDADAGYLLFNEPADPAPKNADGSVAAKTETPPLETKSGLWIVGIAVTSAILFFYIIAATMILTSFLFAGSGSVTIFQFAAYGPWFYVLLGTVFLVDLTAFILLFKYRKKLLRPTK